ncbi:vacuolar protein sorting-associated protein 18 [Anaeramoeba flamelloides]|uniref:Vacuolar protein sorting-associated protein 18 n=1 Tax=Anaeramoeba flamelloides TaxID=1746091 RepID=A0AAV7Z4W7_9EUKA|nr:vacuolar protein sorting-associated protein 18 [Anaeramoeba flamelloides]
MSLIEDFNEYRNSPTIEIEQGYEEISIEREDSRNLPKPLELKPPPIFTLDPLNYRPIDNIKTIISSNNIIYIALCNNFILRYDLSNQNNIETIKFTKDEKCLIKDLFLDPSGNHLIISCKHGVNYYHYARKKVKPRIINKFKQIKIKSVAWDPETNRNEQTPPLLIGSKNGIIFETAFDKKELYNNMLYQFKESDPITGLYFNRFDRGKDYFFVFVSTPEKMRQFIGGPTLSQLFQYYFGDEPECQEFRNDSNFSKIDILLQNNRPMNFAWLTGQNIYVGLLEISGKSRKAGGQIINSASFIPYPTGSDNKLNMPLALAHTEFHFLLVYPHEISIVSRLNSQIVERATLDSTQKQTFIGITHDKIRDLIFAYTSKQIFRLYVDDEDRNIWKIYLDLSKFDLALEHCKSSNQKDQVYKAQATHHYKNKKYSQSAGLFGNTNIPFEEVILKFINLENREPLIIYLSKKIDNIRDTDQTQATIIAFWLLSIYLHEISQIELKLSNKKKKLKMKSNSLNQDSNKSKKQKKKKKKKQNEYEILKKKLQDNLNSFKAFLEDNKEELDSETTYDILKKHGREEFLLAFAEIMENYDLVISHHIQMGNWLEALEKLRRVKSPEIMYKYSPILMYNSPRQTVDTWIKMSKRLNTQRLLPAIMRYAQTHKPKNVKTNQAIRYLEFVIKELRNRDKSIHHFLLWVYIEGNYDRELLAFLKPIVDFPCYDQKYALRLCKKYNKKLACAYLYCEMQLFEKAVEISLTFDIELAKNYADQPEDENLQKQLWLKIAKHVVGQGNIEQDIQFLQETELLSVEDIIQFLPNNMKIEHFKEEIKNSLHNYQAEIEILKENMLGATSRSKLIRDDINSLKNRFVVLSNRIPCSICGNPITGTDFVYFYCEHIYHNHCIRNFLFKHIFSRSRKTIFLNKERKLNEIISHLRSLEINGVISNDNSEYNNLLVQARSLNKKVMDLISSDCVLCGKIAIQLIDQPFINIEDEELVDSWNL